MIKELTIVQTQNTNPYHNLALEEYLLGEVKPGQLILYLWQNAKTVVIGKNQNALDECRIQQLESDGGILVRRKTGGGAVYHDLGNLNFTFLTSKTDFDVTRQTEVILRAVCSLGIPCEKTGRNDIVSLGQKFSGHSYYKTADKAFHNGTLMVNVNSELLSRYLNVSPLKLQSKGVKSVKSRVVNLTERRPDITIETLSNAIMEAASQVYDVDPVIIVDDVTNEMALDKQKMQKLQAQFADPDWNYGQIKPMDYSIEDKFPWGLVRIDFSLNKDEISDMALWSDGLNAQILSSVPGIMIGCAMDRNTIKETILSSGEEYAIIADDLASLISKAKDVNPGGK